MKQRYIFILIVFISSIIFFHPFFLQQKLPIPADTIIGLYHPFRDLYSSEYPNGIPFKNSLITDPVRQQLPWRYLSVEAFKEGNLPLWNPYSFSGYPLFGNFQSGAFHPLNFLLFFLPFGIGWSIIVLVQPVLAGMFMYFYLSNQKLKKIPSFFGAVTFAMSGFMVGWLTWGTLGYVLALMPLVLLAVDRLIEKWTVKWSILFIIAGLAQITSGHLQVWFYSFLLSNAYIAFRALSLEKSGGNRTHFSVSLQYLIRFVLLQGIILFLTLPQWLSTLQFIFESGREADQAIWQKEGWFIPWQHLIQFIAPDFFGNPATLNYWGIWNYAEFIGYIGVSPLIFALIALILLFRKKTVIFFSGVTLISLLFALPTPFAFLPFILDIPLVSTAQPTRLLALVDFSLAVLAAYGLTAFLEKKHRHHMIVLGVCGILIGLLWGVVLGLLPSHWISKENMLIAKKNLILPSVIFGTVSILFLFRFMKDHKRLLSIIVFALVVLTVFDLFRFFHKFTPFTDSSYLFPSSRTIEYLESHMKQNRFMSVDDRILPPNFSVMYKLENVGGYDPLYLQRYAEYIIASERGKPDISSPFGFNRIITPKRFDSRLIDMLGVKYVLSLSDIDSPKVTKVFDEGQTKIYENTSALPRTVFISDVYIARTKQDAIEKLFEPSFNPRTQAVVELSDTQSSIIKRQYASGSAAILSYSPEKIVIKTDLSGEGFLVLFDPYYPTWKAFVCSLSCQQTTLVRTNYLFRGVIVPKGAYRVEFRNTFF